MEPPLMRAACRVAKKSKARFKMGAVIARGNKILSRATNMKKTHPTYGSGEFMYLHCEGHAIYRAMRSGINLEGATIYVYRRYGQLAKPCPCCMKLIRKHGIKEVVYSDPQKVKASIIVHG